MADSWYGAPTCWGVSLAVFELTQGLSDGGLDWLLGIELAVFLLCTVLVPVTVVISLCRRRWWVALGQLSLSILGIAILAVCLVMEGCRSRARLASGESRSWRSSPVSASIPFSIEFRPAHPFLAEYDRRIRFRSGWCVMLEPDTGGGRAFSVYASGADEFLIVDSIDGSRAGAARCAYRVNVAKESVVTIDVSAAAFGGDATRRFVGRIHPSGSVTRPTTPP